MIDAISRHPFGASAIFTWSLMTLVLIVGLLAEWSDETLGGVLMVSLVPAAMFRVHAGKLAQRD